MTEQPMTQEQFDQWKDGYNAAINAAIRELRTPLQKLVDAIESGESGDEGRIKAALKAAKHGLDIYDPE